MDMAALKTAVSNITYTSPADAHSIHKTNPGETDIPNRVFVKGFPREATEDDLKNFFEEYGMVHESKIVKDKTGMLAISFEKPILVIYNRNPFMIFLVNC